MSRNIAEIVDCILNNYSYGVLPAKPQKVNKKSIKTIATYSNRGFNGGIEVVNAQLMSIWEKNGYKVIFYSQEPEDERDYEYPSNVKRIVIGKENDLRTHLKVLAESLLENEVDVFINNNWSSDYIFYQIQLLRELGIYSLIYIHGNFNTYFYVSSRKLMQPKIFSQADGVVVLSKLNDLFYSTFGCNTFFINNPVSEKLKELACPKYTENMHVLYVGRICDEKQPMNALRIFKMTHDKIPNVILDIVGSIDSKNQFKKMKEYIKENSLEKCVFFHGLKTLDETYDYYRTSSVLLCTSRIEGFGMTLLEAKAFGLPIVMFELPYLSIVDDKKGILSSAQLDDRECSENLSKVMSDVNLRKKLALDARESFEEFCKVDISERWNDIFGSLQSDEDKSDRKLEYRLISECMLNSMYEIYNRNDYKLGKIILDIPRKAIGRTYD